MTDPFPLEGGCTCGRVRYRMEAPPLFVHCCHCTWCQRETGSAFALNALIEATRLVRLGGDVLRVAIPSASGRGQSICRCPGCRVALWSTYADAGPAILFLRVGTLDMPSLLPPDIHIYTSTRLPWVQLPPDTRVVPAFYVLRDAWPADSVARYGEARSSTPLSSPEVINSHDQPLTLRGRSEGTSGSFAALQRRPRT